MATNVMIPGASKTATVPITFDVAGLACTMEVWVGPDQNHKVASSGQKAFTTAVTAVNVACPITMPTAAQVSANPVLQTFVDVYYQGTFLFGFIDVNTVTIIIGSVGPIIWS